MEKPTSLYLLLSAYWQHMDALTEAMHRTDETKFDTPEHEAAFAAQGAIGDRLNEAEQAIAAFLPNWTHEAKLKADFLTYLAKGNHGSLSDDVVTALLHSLPALVKYQTGREKP